MGYPICGGLMRFCVEALGYLFCEGLQRFLWSGALGLSEDSGHGVDVAEAMDLVAGKLQHGHGAEAVHGLAVAGGEAESGVTAGATLDAGFAASEQDGGGESFDVELEGAVEALVEVVNVEG